MFKHFTLAMAFIMGACAFAQAPVQEAVAAQVAPVVEAAQEAVAPAVEAVAEEAVADKFAGISSMVQLVKLRRQLLLENELAFNDKSNDTDAQLRGAYLHLTNGYMTTDETPGAVKEEYEQYNYWNNPHKGNQRMLKFPDLVGKQLDLPSVSGVVHSHQVGDWQLTASRIASMWDSTGIVGFTLKDQPAPAGVAEALPTAHPPTMLPFGISQLLMIVICLFLVYLALIKEFEPLLLLPIGFGGLLANIPFAGITAAPVLDSLGNVVEPGGFLYYTFEMGVSSGLFPILIFMGVGAMTDFGPLIANPRMALLGAAAQLGIFTALLGALALTLFCDNINFFITDAASIGIIGGADGPTAIWLTTKLSPDLLGAIAVAAYSYMALVPVIQPPIMKLLTTKEERLIKMKQLRTVSKTEKVLFPVIVLLLCAALLPSAAALIGAVMLGNLAKECGVVDRISDTMANSLCNIVTILLGLSVGSKLAAEKFLTWETIGILILGVVAFSVGTAGGVWMVKLMNLFSKEKVNPLIGSAGVSAVPMAARVSNKVGLEYDPSNFLLMHAMGPNVSGVIGSAVVAGVLYFCCR